VTGTFINIIAILMGGTLGMVFGARLPERIRQTVIAGLGLFTAVIGIQMTFKTQQALVVLGALLIGGVLGEWMRLEERLSKLGEWLEQRFTTKDSPALVLQAEALTNPTPGHAGTAQESAQTAKGGSRFVRGFLTASLVYTIGPMAILGAIQDGLTGDFSLLAIKSVMDGFASLAFASSLGVGVLFSSLVILVYQGGISLLAAQAQAWFTTAMMNEMTATGGVLLLGLAISSLLEIKPIRVGNFLPALAVAPLIVAVLVPLHLY
jgi:uncharacterized protein